MALTDKLSAIANAIREKSGKSGALTLDQMPGEIRNLSIGTVAELVPGAAPDYVTAESYRVASEVRNILDGEYKYDNCVVCICMSDSHYYPDTATKNGVWSGVNAIKALTYMLPVDFIAHLGDVAHESQDTQTTNALQIERMNTMLGWLKECSGGNLPLFVAVGNHDTSVYITKDTDYHDVMSAEYLYNNFTMLSKIDDDTVVSGAECGGYCYRDFKDKKLRVYLLNTGDNTIRLQDSREDCTSEIQRAWIASTLKELNAKTDAAEWGFIVLCHYPLDYGGNINLSNLFEAYVSGKSISVNGSTYNFNGSNVAKFVVQFHGHVHNFLVGKLHYGSTSSATPYDVYRMCIPNAQSNRENTYGVVGSVNFAQPEKYLKTAGTSEDTSLVVKVINFDKKLIHSYKYGAGYDRLISFEGATYYAISQTLTRVSSSNSLPYVEENSSFNTVLTPDAKCEFKHVSVTMGGVDITASVYDNGTVNIPKVTGDVVIVAKAQAIPKFTNVVYSSIDTDGSVYNGGLGYIDNYRINSSNELVYFDGGDTNMGPCVTTGYIPVTPNKTHTIRIAGEGVSGESMNYGRLAFYDANFNLVTKANGDVTAPWSWNNLTSSAGFTVTEESATVLTVTVNNTSTGYKASYIRICVFGKGENLIVTIDEPVEYEA